MSDAPIPSNAPVAAPADQEKKPQQQRKEKKPAGPKPAAKKGEAKKPDAAPQKKKGKNQEGLTAGKLEDFASWYTQVITKAEMIDYYDISGCYILRPFAYSIWEEIQKFFDARSKKLGVQNAYFPLLVSEKALVTEKKHIEDFAPEVAWVTRCGQSDLNEPVAIRPTSETIMYPAFARWIRSHRDLPLKLNQWNNVVRWEFKAAVPFLRSREFLWQEGHTAFATRAEADKEVLEVLDLYRSVYEDLLAIPVVKGRKSEGEKFPGGDYTTTVEGFIPTNGRGIQGATSHHLGQNFSKMFNIVFENIDKKQEFAYQNSWGITTRTIGVMIMVHGDDIGLVLPPRVAPIQVVVIPLHFKDTDHAAIDSKANEIAALLNEKGIRAQADMRDHLNPGNKYNYWDIRGIPVKIEVGPKDIAANQVVASRRDTLKKEPISMDGLADKVQALLEDIQKSLFEKAKKERDEHIVKITKWEEFVPALDGKNLVLAPWSKDPASEEDLKQRSREESKARAAAGANQENEEAGFRITAAAKCLCIPLEQPELPEGTLCFLTGKPAVCWALFGRSY
jgi:prolyl-tRNA synthetase